MQCSRIYWLGIVEAVNFNAPIFEGERREEEKRCYKFRPPSDVIKKEGSKKNRNAWKRRLMRKTSKRAMRKAIGELVDFVRKRATLQGRKVGSKNKVSETL